MRKGCFINTQMMQRGYQVITGLQCYKKVSGPPHLTFLEGTAETFAVGGKYQRKCSKSEGIGLIDS